MDKTQLSKESTSSSDLRNEEAQAPLSWDEYFMLIALFTSLRSKDPRSKIGAVVVDQNRHIVGTGYNGFVVGADEARFSWNSEGEWLDTKHAYVVHAEVNAIINSTTHDLHGCVVYSTLFPCNECAKVIAQKQIKEVVYLSRKKFDHESREAARTIFSAAGVTVRQGTLPPFDDLVRQVLDGITASAR